MEEFIVVKEHPSLIDYIDQLQRKNAEALSFYPRVTFEREAENGRLYLGLLNGEPSGYIYVGAAGGDVKCHQVAIQYDARRKLYGAMLVVAMEQYANESLSSSITLRCGFDLEANHFWKAMGYNCIATVDGGVRRMRRINIWRKYLQPQLFEPEYVEPESGKTSATLWRKHKDTGIITQFARGDKLKDYRLKLLRANETT